MEEVCMPILLIMMAASLLFGGLLSFTQTLHPETTIIYNPQIYHLTSIVVGMMIFMTVGRKKFFGGTE